jgi:predicted cation transporter
VYLLFMITIGLALIAVLVLVLPLAVKRVERQLELFLLAAGALAVTVSGRWNLHLVFLALREPLIITGAVVVAGHLFRFLARPLEKGVDALAARIGRPLLTALLVIILGFASSIITAIVAALVLVELVGHLRLGGETEARVVVAACFAIGLGAALTPVGEPLTTLVVSKLSGPPHHAGFFFLARMLWMFIVPGVLVFGALAGLAVSREKRGEEQPRQPALESYRAVLIRTVKVYGFVAGLVLLGEGFRPLIDAYVVPLPRLALFWINAVSAFLDNATLAAAEIGPSLAAGQVLAALLGLLAAGGMLVPGNIPNIISAGKLGISARQWARLGVPAGLALMAVIFVILVALY